MHWSVVCIMDQLDATTYTAWTVTYRKKSTGIQLRRQNIVLCVYSLACVSADKVYGRVKRHAQAQSSREVY
jgi:hypothetical protein